MSSHVKSSHVMSYQARNIMIPYHLLLHLEGNVQGWHLAIVQELQRRRGAALSGRSQDGMGGVGLMNCP